MRKLVLALVATGVLAAPASAGTSSAPLTEFTAWSASGPRIAFVARTAGGKRGYLWAQAFGAARPTLLRSRPPLGQEEIDALAAGPRGSWGSLQRAGGSLYTVSSRGGGARVTAAGVRQVFGDGTFLGYLAIGRLFRVVGADSLPVATLGDVDVQQVAVGSGTIAIREANGTVDVLTTGGKRLVTIKANAASVALAAKRVVVRTRTRRLVVYGLYGGLVHNWPLAAKSWTASLGAYGGYAVYLGANKAVRAVRLANGVDRIVARAGAGWYFDGVALGSQGATVPLTVKHGTSFTVTLRFLPTAALRAATGG